MGLDPVASVSAPAPKKETIMRNKGSDIPQELKPIKEVKLCLKWL